MSTGLSKQPRSARAATTATTADTNHQLIRLRQFVLIAAAVLTAAAQDQTPRRASDWPCAGARKVDPSHVSVAEGTGGHVYLFGPGEVAQSGSLMAWHYRHREVMFRAMGEMKQPAREFTFPVDSMVDSLVVTISLQCKDSIVILNASGVEPAGEPVEFRAGKALRVAHPAPGAWKVRLAGRGLFFVTVEAVSELSLGTVRFVEPGGRPGHEGLFPMKSPPPLGGTGLLEIEMAKAPPVVKVRLVDSESNTLDSLTADAAAAGGPILARVPLRHARFRLAVEGADARGFPFQRMHSPLTVLAPAPAQ